MSKYKDIEFSYMPVISGEYCSGSVSIREFADKEAYEFDVSFDYVPADPENDRQTEGSCMFTLEYGKDCSADEVALGIASVAEYVDDPYLDKAWFAIDQGDLAGQIAAAFEYYEEDKAGAEE